MKKKVNNFDIYENNLSCNIIFLRQNIIFRRIIYHTLQENYKLSLKSFNGSFETVLHNTRS